MSVMFGKFFTEVLVACSSKNYKLDKLLKASALALNLTKNVITIQPNLLKTPKCEFVAIIKILFAYGLTLKVNLNFLCFSTFYSSCNKNSFYWIYNIALRGPSSKCFFV